MWNDQSTMFGCIDFGFDWHLLFNSLFRLLIQSTRNKFRKKVRVSSCKFCQSRGPLSKTLKNNVMTDMSAFWCEQGGPARTHVSPKNNHEKNVTSELWERYDWTNSEGPNEREREIWLMFQKQPSSGIPQAGRGDKHLLTLLCLLYVITFPHSRPDAAGSSVHSAQASPAWEPHEKGNHWLLLSGLFLLREILFEGSCLDYLVWEVFKSLPVAITDKNWQANGRLNTETISFFCNGTLYGETPL